MATDSQKGGIEEIVKMLQFGQEVDEEPGKTCFNDDNHINQQIKQPMEVAKFKEVQCKSAFIDEQINKSKLSINNPIECAKAFGKDDRLGFLQFVSPVFIDTYMQSATQAILNSKESLQGKRSSFLLPNYNV